MTHLSVRHILASAVLITAFPAIAEDADSLADALANGETHLEFRYRYEFVDQDGFAEDAHASTLRARLNYQTGSFRNTNFFVEFDVLEEVLADDFNSGAGTSGPDRARFPVVADPDGTEVNQAWVQYTGFDNTEVRLGRQRINLDNQRFVGGVGWRQNEQTYDAISVHNASFENTKIFYAYIGNVNRIFGGDVAAGDHESETHLFNVGYNFEGSGRLNAYYYAIDNEDNPSFSTDTLGLRFVGQSTLSGHDLSYTIEAAWQEEASNNPVNFDETYYRLDSTLDLSAVTLLAGYEVLGGDADAPGSAFRTPLATLHAFNGWSDRFLATPGAGLADFFIGASGALANNWRWQAVFHDFQAEDRGPDYGDEIDLSVTRKFGKHYNLLLKFADFSADAPTFNDTTNAWVMLSGNF